MGAFSSLRKAYSVSVVDMGALGIPKANWLMLFVSTFHAEFIGDESLGEGAGL